MQNNGQQYQEIDIDDQEVEQPYRPCGEPIKPPDFEKLQDSERENITSPSFNQKLV